LQRAAARLAALADLALPEAPHAESLVAGVRSTMASAFDRGAGLRAAQQALASAAETFRVRSAGLIYEHRSPDPAIQSLTDGILSAAEAYATGRLGRVPAADVAACLRYLERQVTRAVAQGVAAQTFAEMTSLAAHAGGPGPRDAGNLR
jgi:hypothetical protein